MCRRLLGRIGKAVGRGHKASDGKHVFRAGAPSDTRRDVGSVNHDRFVENRAFVSVQCLPIGKRCIPCLALGCHRTALEIAKGRFIGRNQASACAALDAHVADGQAFFDAHRLEHGAAIFDDVAGAARCADHADHMHDDVLGGDAGAHFALDPHFHRLGLLQQQRLRRQHVLNLARADAKCQRAKTAVAGRVRIAANDCGARKRKALFRPHHMDDPLFRVRIADVADAKVRRVLFQRGQLLRALGVLDRDLATIGIAARGGRQIVIRNSQGEFGPAHLAPCKAQSLKGLRAGHLVDQMPVDVDDRGPVVAGLDHVIVPDFLVKGARFRLGGIGHWRARFSLCSSR